MEIIMNKKLLLFLAMFAVSTSLFPAAKPSDDRARADKAERDQLAAATVVTNGATKKCKPAAPAMKEDGEIRKTKIADTLLAREGMPDDAIEHILAMAQGTIPSDIYANNGRLSNNGRYFTSVNPDTR